mgnify:CR=1 FL=1
MRDLDTLLRTMSARSASDLHLKPTRPPLIRVHGKLVALEEEPLTPDEIHGMVDSILAPHQKRKLEAGLMTQEQYDRFFAGRGPEHIAPMVAYLCTDGADTMMWPNG